MSTPVSFFAERKEQSRVKTEIVRKYFIAWAKIILGAQDRFPHQGESKIAYIDLFSGPGLYEDETKSTPIEVLELAINDAKLRERLVVVLNDSNEDYARRLSDAITKLNGIELLKHKPRVSAVAIDENTAHVFEDIRTVPSLVFLDPWGYKGISLDLIRALLKDWGNDCIIFFNYNRINMALSNPSAREDMVALFGDDALTQLENDLKRLRPKERETQVIEAFCRVLKDSSPARYVLPFRFVDDKGCRTSHHIIFASKHFRGYEVMKDIMARESSSTDQGVPSLEYNPIDKRISHKQPFLFQHSQPLDDLGEMLLHQFASRTLSMKEIYEEHSVDRSYIKGNYKEVLRQLEEKGRIEATKHRIGTFGDDVKATFPPQED